jgi:hypothetical protein
VEESGRSQEIMDRSTVIPKFDSNSGPAFGRGSLLLGGCEPEAEYAKTLHRCAGRRCVPIMTTGPERLDTQTVSESAISAQMPQ